jgi:hypothetical protein
MLKLTIMTSINRRLLYFPECSRLAKSAAVGTRYAASFPVIYRVPQDMSNK